MPFAQAGDVRLHYEERGNGSETILFAHGWTGSWMDWTLVLDRLPKGFRGIAIDHRGAGDSDKPDSGYTIQQYSDDLYAFATALGLSNFTFIGHSMGGAITYQFVVDHPELLKAAVPSAPTGADGYDWTQDSIDYTRANRLNREQMVADARTYYLRPVPEEVLQAGVDQAMRCSEGHVFDSIESMRHLKLGDRLAQTKVPLLWVGSDSDAAIPVRMLVGDWAKVPGAHLQIFTRTSHSFTVEMPDEYTRTIVDFIRSV